MKFDPMAPEREHRRRPRACTSCKLWTTFDRAARVGRAVGRAVVAGAAPGEVDSLFQDPGLRRDEHEQEPGGRRRRSASSSTPSTTCRTRTGSASTSARASTLHFEGREYTEMWEVFAYAGDSRGSGPLILDADPTTLGRPAAEPSRHHERRELPRDRRAVRDPRPARPARSVRRRSAMSSGRPTT